MKVLLFGSGRAGENLIADYMLGNIDIEILGILDNDKEKWGKNISGYEIFPPKKLLNDIEYNYILIASQYFKEIEEQLINEYNIEPNKIKVAPKSLISSIKSYRPFEIDEIYEMINKIFYDLLVLFNKENINYYIDHGTLLGIVRHGSIMRWDDDIDFTILEEDFYKAKDIFINYFYKEKNYNKYISGSIEKVDVKITMDVDYGGLEKVVKTIIYIKRKNIIHTVNIDMVYVHFDDENAYQKLTYAPKKHFIDFDIIKYKDLKIRVPYDYKEYLKYHYGEDWNVVKKDIGWNGVLNRLYREDYL